MEVVSTEERGQRRMLQRVSELEKDPGKRQLKAERKSQITKCYIESSRVKLAEAAGDLAEITGRSELTLHFPSVYCFLRYETIFPSKVFTVR